MAGLLSDITGFIDRSKQAAKANLGLLFNDPKEYLATMEGQARDFNRLQSLAVQGDINASKGISVTPEQLAARQYVDRVTNDIAMGFAGTVGTSARKLPLPDMGEITKFSKPLPAGSLYRETSSEGLLDLFHRGSPFGAPVSYFAEIPEMAIGQGFNKGVMFKVQSEGLTGRPYLGKPGLEQAYLNRAGEFEVKDAPQKILKSVTDIWVSPEAYKGMRKPQKIVFDRYLGELERRGIKVNKVDKLPGRFED